MVNEHYHPGLVVAAGVDDDDGKIPLLAGRSLNAGLPTAYLCERFSCKAPVTDPADLRGLLAP